ncbi:hypothetical protein S7335_3053 [Synechococcus sp. PCC 7335]|nr:hypothetical protein S7335_3053 [Synechococcus sp. PCC 7335]
MLFLNTAFCKNFGEKVASSYLNRHMNKLKVNCCVSNRMSQVK